MKTHPIRAAAFALTLLGSSLEGLGTASLANAAEVTVGSLTISGGFSRATLPNAPVGGGFLTITNTGAEDDRLVSATSPAAGDVQIHEMKMEGDVMKMAQLPDGLPIPAGQTVTLQPGGFHLMFMQLKQALVEGTKLPVTLTFEKAGSIEVELDIEGIAATAPAHQMNH
jgi:periplasmic copper chaperone A